MAEKFLTKTNVQKVWSFVKTQAFLAIVVIALITYAAIQRNTINDLKREKAISEQNQLAFQDTIKMERTKNGAMQGTIAGYVASEKELKEINRALYDEVRAQKGTVLSLNKALIQLVLDTTQLRASIVLKDKIIGEMVKIDSNTYSTTWTLPYQHDSLNFDIFKGKTTIKILSKNPLVLKHLDTEMIKRITQIDLTWGQKVEDENMRVFIQSKYPGFSVTQLEGVLIDPSTIPYYKNLMKKKHWFQGFSLGLGAAAGFNVTGGGYGFVIGPTASWNIYTW